MIPTADHSALSPSGRVSKSARLAMLKREHARLFPPGYWDAPEPTEAEECASKAESLRRSAATLREMAARGMHVRKYPKAAEALEREAAELCR